MEEKVEIKIGWPENPRERLLAQAWAWISGVLVLLLLAAAVAFFIPKGPSFPRQEGPFQVTKDGNLWKGKVSDLKELPTVSLWNMGSKGFYLVRLPQEGYVSLGWIDPSSGCRIQWEEKGPFFRDPCRGYRYNLEGLPMAGPDAPLAPRSLKRLPMDIRGKEITIEVGR